MGLINGGESLWTCQPLRALTNPLPRSSVGKPALNFNDPYRKTVRVKIVDEEEYERQENFFIVLGEPKWMERGISGVRFLKKKK